MINHQKALYTALGLIACAVIFTCTQVSFDDPFTGENALPVPIISMVGPSPYYLNLNDAYYELGAIAFDTANHDTVYITDRIEIVINEGDDSVSTHSPGEHIVKYYAQNDEGIKGKTERRVIVREITGPDTEKPVITILGLNPKVLFVGEPYNDEGATAYDSVDGDLADSIKTYGDNITTDKPDSFEVLYEVMDKAGNVARSKRAVFVLDSDDKVPPVITLTGNERDSIILNQVYVDPGATAWDEIDGDLTDQIVTVDSVNNTVSGVYPIHYSVSDKAGNTAKKTRYIHVLDLHDTIPPVITLLGDAVMKVDAGGIFIDPGATAMDNVDGDISDSIVYSGSVDMQKLGDYYFYYNVSDNSGNQAVEKKRTVTVVDTSAPTIHINTPNPVNLFIGSTYTEWGATARDNLDGDITHKLDTVGYVNENTNDSVNTSAVGVYRVHYIVQDAAGHTTDRARIVNVRDPGDTIPPVITLLGDNPLRLDVSEPYNEPGATALDDKDGDLTDSIKINSDSINILIVGFYRVHYTVSDSIGNSSHKIRVVVVGDAVDSVVIGTGSATGEDLPYRPWYQYTYSQSIYLESSLNVEFPINITEIYYYYSGSSWTDAIVVYMGNTSKRSFSGTSDWIPVGSMTQVYSGNFSATTTAGWHRIVLNNPFTYNGSDNLVVAIDENSEENHNMDDSFHCTSQGSVDRSLSFGTIMDDNPNPSNPPSGTLSDYAPNIIIVYRGRGK